MVCVVAVDNDVAGVDDTRPAAVKMIDIYVNSASVDDAFPSVPTVRVEEYVDRI